MTNAREKLMEAMAVERHNAWREEWIALGHKEHLPTWDKITDGARKAALRCEEKVLGTIEAAGGWAPPGHWIAPTTPTFEMRNAAWENEFLHALEAYRVMQEVFRGVPITYDFAAMRTASLEDKERTE